MKSIVQKLFLDAKIVARPVVWKVLDLYDRLFSVKRKKVKQFDKIVRENNICFTTDINTEGFSDQLCRLIFFYKVGNRLGLKYYHTPLASNRSTPVLPKKESENSSDSYSDIYDFLGINSGLKKISTDIIRSDFEEIFFDLDEMEFEKRIRLSYSNLLYFLKAKLIDQIPGHKNVLIHFSGSPNVFLLYKLIAHQQASNLPFRKFYFKTREEKPWKSRFSENKIKLMVHIRQGDTAIIKMPWKTFISVCYQPKNRFTEVKNKEEIEEYGVIGVDHYYNFLQKLYNHFDIQLFSNVIYSDGFNKAFQIIKKGSLYEDFTTSKKNEFKDLHETYDEKQFKDFYKWKNVDLVIGEEREKLFDLIQSFFEADIIIFGTQAKMMPKLVSIYSDSDTMPLLINLYQKNHPNIDYLGIDHSSERVLFVDANDYDMDHIANRIKKYLVSRNRM